MEEKLESLRLKLIEENLKAISQINMSLATNDRKTMVETIWKLAREEYETPESVLELALSEKEDIVSCLNSVKEYYLAEENN